MPFPIVPYSESHVPAVRRFNERLRQGGAPADYVFSESHIPNWLPRCDDSPVYNEFFLALEGEEVRGAFVLKHQAFSFAGCTKLLVYLHHPLSEGVIDKRYSQIGAKMLMHIVRQNPSLFALGMGGYDRPLPRILLALRWKHCLIPYYFRVCNVAKFLREMQVLRATPARRLIADVAAFTGLGPVTLTALQAARSWRTHRNGYGHEVVTEFGDWADLIWNLTAPEFAMIAVRDARTLRVLYPSENKKVTRIRVRKYGQIVGWAVVGILYRPGHEQYRDLRVGTILDALAPAQHAGAVVGAATTVLEQQGADLVGCNQSHAAWTAALSRHGFLKGPSNFIFAAAPAVSNLLEPFHATMDRVHLNRGDGDNLLQYL